MKNPVKWDLHPKEVVLSPVYPSGMDKVIAKDATKPITIQVSPEHARKAVCRDGRNCVVAKAFEAHFGEFFEGFEIGTSITKLQCNGRVMRYGTPANLKKHIQHFDLTGRWDLPEGSYTFNPPSPSARLGGRPSRWNKHQNPNRTSGRDAFRARAIPTRRVSRVVT